MSIDHVYRLVGRIGDVYQVVVLCTMANVTHRWLYCIVVVHGVWSRFVGLDQVVCIVAVVGLDQLGYGTLGLLVVYIVDQFE